MIRLCFTLLFLSSVSLAHAQFDVKEQLEKKIIQDKYIDFLTDKGYAPEVDPDGDIKFSYNDRSYYITIDMKEKNFFRIAKLANLKLDSEYDITKAMKICHEVTKEVKVAKVYWINGVIWTSSEIILSEREDFTSIFDRVLKLTEDGYLKFVELWKEA